MSGKGRPLSGFRKRLSGRRGNKETQEDNNHGANGRNDHHPEAAGNRGSQPAEVDENSRRQRRSIRGQTASPPKYPPAGQQQQQQQQAVPLRRSHSLNENDEENGGIQDEEDEIVSPSGRQGRSEGRPNVFQRLRERSRSRSRSQRNMGENRKEMLVAVTSCRSDGYYNEKAPGSTTKLPRKAPTNLKLFHELAVGVKDAYAAVGAVPRKPTEDDKANLSKDEYEAMVVLWDFVGNLDFVSLSPCLPAGILSTL